MTNNTNEDCCGGNCSPEGIESPNSKAFKNVMDLTSETPSFSGKYTLESTVEAMQAPEPSEPTPQVVEIVTELALQPDPAPDPAPVTFDPSELDGFGQAQPKDDTRHTKEAIVVALKSLELVINNFPKSFYMSKASFSLNNAIGYLQNDIVGNG